MSRLPKNLDDGGHPEYSNCRRCIDGRLHFVMMVSYSDEEKYECDLCGQPVFVALLECGEWSYFAPYVDTPEYRAHMRQAECLRKGKPVLQSSVLCKTIRKYRRMCDERQEGREA